LHTTEVGISCTNFMLPNIYDLPGNIKLYALLPFWQVAEKSVLRAPAQL
jgi:hypothetical protein